jgi:hypothetical protein
MPKAGKSRERREQPKILKGWKAIGEYLGIGEASAQRWAKGGMPVKRQGRYMVAEASELRQRLGRETHMPGAAHVLTDNPGEDISAALRESIFTLRRHKRRT